MLISVVLLLHRGGSGMFGVDGRAQAVDVLDSIGGHDSFGLLGTGVGSEGRGLRGCRACCLEVNTAQYEAIRTLGLKAWAAGSDLGMAAPPREGGEVN